MYHKLSGSATGTVEKQSEINLYLLTCFAMWFIVENVFGNILMTKLTEGKTAMKRLAILVTAVALLLSASIPEAFAVTSESKTSTQKKVMFYLKPDISVELNGVRQMFRNVNGQNVYPIIYNGTTYLPVRAVSAIMEEPVEWDKGSRTVYIGKTLTYPIKSTAGIQTSAAGSADESDVAFLESLSPSLVTGYLQPDVLVMYDFVIQSMKNANGVTVYPLNYDGSIYLPIRSVSRLMNEPITWDGTVQKISIGDGEEEEKQEEIEPTENELEDEPADEVDATALLLKNIYENEEALYYEASAKISSIKDADLEQRQAIAASASENYLKAQEITQEVKAINTTSFSEDEKNAYDKLIAFAESNEYYILVLENIAYLAAADSDYSMLAETFLYFAMEAQTNMKQAKELIIDQK